MQDLCTGVGHDNPRPTPTAFDGKGPDPSFARKGVDVKDKKLLETAGFGRRSSSDMMHAAQKGRSGPLA